MDGTSCAGDKIDIKSECATVDDNESKSRPCHAWEEVTYRLLDFDGKLLAAVDEREFEAWITDFMKENI